MRADNNVPTLQFSLREKVAIFCRDTISRLNKMILLYGGPVDLHVAFNLNLSSS